MRKTLIHILICVICATFTKASPTVYGAVTKGMSQAINSVGIRTNLKLVCVNGTSIGCCNGVIAAAIANSLRLASTVVTEPENLKLVRGVFVASPVEDCEKYAIVSKNYCASFGSKYVLGEC
ncbi:uncharacterized protein VTP21DRAFT_79 [Calcarisporiella thermophila]|uniref:uncharacterized protein n=1 Tax=Calcarisporiella thermophila TaxID=911321 RepID=UPI0037443F73